MLSNSYNSTDKKFLIKTIAILDSYFLLTRTPPCFSNAHQNKLDIFYMLEILQNNIIMHHKNLFDIEDIKIYAWCIKKFMLYVIHAKQFSYIPDPEIIIIIKKFIIDLQSHGIVHAQITQNELENLEIIEIKIIHLKEKLEENFDEEIKKELEILVEKRLIQTSLISQIPDIFNTLEKDLILVANLTNFF